jgi:hypothetical protein
MVLSCLGSHRASILTSGPNPDKPGILQLPHQHKAPPSTCQVLNCRELVLVSGGANLEPILELAATSAGPGFGQPVR